MGGRQTDAGRFGRVVSFPLQVMVESGAAALRVHELSAGGMVVEATRRRGWTAGLPARDRRRRDWPDAGASGTAGCCRNVSVSRRRIWPASPSSMSPPIRPRTSHGCSRRSTSGARAARIGVKVGHVQVGAGRARRRAVDDQHRHGRRRQYRDAGGRPASPASEIVRVTVNVPEAAAAVPEIKRQLLDQGCTVPIVGDFHYNGHLLLTRISDCAKALDKYRINPGTGHDVTSSCDGFSATWCAGSCQEAGADRRATSPNQELMQRMQENIDRQGGSFDDIINDCMVELAVTSTNSPSRRPARGSDDDSCKVSRARHSSRCIGNYRDASTRTSD